MIDEKDQKILDILTENSRLSSREIARKINIPVMTVLNRIKKMEEEGIIIKYTSFLNLEKLGYPLICYILIAFDYGLLKEKKIYQSDIVDKLLKHSSVLTASVVTGPARDAIVKIKARNIAELNRILDDFRELPGVKRTDTMNVLYEARRETRIPIKCKRKKADNCPENNDDSEL